MSAYLDYFSTLLKWVPFEQVGEKSRVTLISNVSRIGESDERSH